MAITKVARGSAIFLSAARIQNVFGYAEIEVKASKSPDVMLFQRYRKHFELLALRNITNPVAFSVIATDDPENTQLYEYTDDPENTQAKSTDRDKLTANKLTANQWFRHSDLVTVASSQSEGLRKMALGIVKYFYLRPSQLFGVIWFAFSLFAVSSSRSVVVDPFIEAQKQKVIELCKLKHNFQRGDYQKFIDLCNI